MHIWYEVEMAAPAAQSKHPTNCVYCTSARAYIMKAGCVLMQV
jgi:hypothetical protein